MAESQTRVARWRRWIQLITLVIALLALLAGGASLALGVLFYLDRPQIRTAISQAEQAAQVTNTMESRVSTAEGTLNALQEDIARLRFQNHLLRASLRINRARTHLAERQGGLAIRELAEIERALDEAAKLGTPGQQEQIAEIKKIMGDLKSAIDAQSYPIPTVEILGDRIDAMIHD